MLTKLFIDLLCKSISRREESQVSKKAQKILSRLNENLYPVKYFCSCATSFYGVTMQILTSIDKLILMCA